MKPSSLQKAIYNQLYFLERGEVEHMVQPARNVSTKERRNSAKSRGHRLDQFLTVHKPTPRERVNAIRGMLSIHEQGFLTDENLLIVIANIVKGE